VIQLTADCELLENPQLAVVVGCLPSQRHTLVRPERDAGRA